MAAPATVAAEHKVPRTNDAASILLCRRRDLQCPVLPGICNIECSVGSSGTLVIWPPVHCDRLVCQKSTVAALGKVNK